ncbi:MAG: M28 family peptidase, partial [Thermoplasmatales archaeon]|nr:M28 family peptidase [Thermoplasmatales archaeon]
AALNADMIGFAENEDDASKIRVYEDDSSEWLAEFTRDVSQEYNEHMELEVISSGYSWGSDHYRFWEAGYHAIFYAEYNFNDYYHSPEDTIERMNIPYAIRASKLIIATLAELSEITKSNAPLKPAAPEGINSGRINEEYTYTASTTDPDEDELFYQFDWGNGDFSEWIGPYNSGDIAEATYTWAEKEDYEIRAKAKDEFGFESPWSDPLEISMPKNKPYINTPFIRFLENHPYLFPLLRQLLGL